MLVLTGKGYDLLDFCGSNILRIHPANSHPFAMNLEHDLGGFFAAHREETLEDHDDELHRSVIVIQQNHLEKRGGLELAFLRFKDCSLFYQPCRHTAKINLYAETRAFSACRSSFSTDRRGTNPCPEPGNTACAPVHNVMVVTVDCNLSANRKMLFAARGWASMTGLDGNCQCA